MEVQEFLEKYLLLAYLEIIAIIMMYITPVSFLELLKSKIES